MISKSMENLVKNNSVIRQMFEEGKILSQKYGKENVFDFSLGNPSINPPVDVDNAIIKLIMNENKLDLHGYMSNSGYDDVRENVAKYLNNEFNTSFNKNNIIMCTGAAGGINIVLKYNIDKDDEVIVFRPYFMEYRNYIANYNGKFVEVDFDNQFNPDLEDFKNKITKKTRAIIINNPNNPSGAVYNENIIKSIAKILEEKEAEYGKDIFIISDEPYREIVYDGEIVPYITKYYNNTFVVYSFSKSLSLPGERIGYVVIPDEMNDKENIFEAVTIANRILGFVNAPSLMQKLIGKIIGKTADLNEYKKNRDLLYNGLTQIGYEAFKPKGAFYLFLKSPIEDEKEFCNKAKEYNILMVPGSSFACPGYVRLSYCIDSNMIERSLNRFKELFSCYKL